MNEQKLARMAGQEDDYAKLGIKPGQVEQWEDGMRTSGGRESFEWWYFDSHLDDESSLVIGFHTKWELNPKGKEKPFVVVDITGGGRPDKHLMINAEAKDFIASKERCDVSVKGCHFTGDLHTYHIKVVDEGITIDVELVGQVPSWRPMTGHIYFGKHDEHFFAWLVPVLQGNVTVTIAEKGSPPRQLTGIGYHDHNWGDVVMSKLFHHWYWGRGQAGPYSLVASYLYAEKEYGRTELPAFMLAKDGKIVADLSSNVKFDLEDEFMDEKSGKPVANRVIYDYQVDDKERYRVTFQRERTILDFKWADMVTGYKHALARLARMDGAYIRFSGPVTVERYIDEKMVEKVSDPGIWELMYFGHVEKEERKEVLESKAV